MDWIYLGQYEVYNLNIIKKIHEVLLLINNVHKNNSGIYRCVTKNQLVYDEGKLTVKSNTMKLLFHVGQCYYTFCMQITHKQNVML